MAVRKFEIQGVKVAVTTEPTRNGEVIVELKMTCDPTHPTGVTTTMLQQVTARQLRGIGEPTNRQIDYFLSVSFPEPRRQASKRGATDERFLKQVAHVYLQALRQSMPPTKAVQRWAGTTRPTASRWVRQARDVGLIGQPTKKGQPGDIRQP